MMEEKLLCFSKRCLTDEQNHNKLCKINHPDEYHNKDLIAFNSYFFDVNKPFKFESLNINQNNNENTLTNQIKLNNDFNYRSLKMIQNENDDINNDLMKLNTINDDILFTKTEIKSIEKLSKNVFKTRNFAFLKKKKKIKEKSYENSTVKKKKNSSHVKKTNVVNKSQSENKNAYLKVESLNQYFKMNNKNKENDIDIENSRRKYNLDPIKERKRIIFKIENNNTNKQDQTIVNLSLVSNKLSSKNTNDSSTEGINYNNNNNSHHELLESNEAFKTKLKSLNIYSNNLTQKAEIESNKKIRIKWTADEDKKLIKIKQDFPYLSWFQVSQFFENRSKIDCMNRYLKVVDPNLKKGKWTKEDDEILKNWVNLNGDKNWFNIVKANLLRGRNCKQIRDRWVNCLRPQLKVFEWTNKNEKILLEKFLIYGTSWTKISAFIPNTSENTIKNKFYSMLRKTANLHLAGTKNKKHKVSHTFDVSKELNLSVSEESNKAFTINQEIHKEFDLKFIQELKGKNRKKKYIEQDLADTYLNLNSSNTKTNTVSNTTGRYYPESSSVIADKLDFQSPSAAENIESNVIVGSKKKKKNNYSLDSLMNFLPLLLKEKMISYEKAMEAENHRSAFNIVSLNDNDEKLNDSVKNEFDHNLKQKIRLDFLNTLKKPFDKKKEMIRKELINKIKRISNSKLKNLHNNNVSINNNCNNFNINFEDKLNRVSSIMSNNELLFEKNFPCEKENFMMNSFNNLNNNLGGFSNFNNKLQNLILSNNNITNLNDSFISNGDDLLDNFFSNNRINLNFSNSDFQNNNNINNNNNNKNSSNSFNFSDLLDLENNNNINLLNNSNQSINRNNSCTNISESNNPNNTNIQMNNVNMEIKQISNQTFGKLNRMKSSIMLNLQLNMLNKIVEKIRNNYVQKFFSNFKNNTLFKVPNGVPNKSQPSSEGLKELDA